MTAAEVVVDDRYQRSSFISWSSGESVPGPEWNLHGTSWADAPPPPVRHGHWAQTVVRGGGVSAARCPCGATYEGGAWQQFHEPRVTLPRPALPYWRRIFKRRAEL